MIVGIGNILNSIFAGVVVFSLIGYLAYDFQMPIDKVMDQGLFLSFSLLIKTKKGKVLINHIVRMFLTFNLVLDPSLNTRIVGSSCLRLESVLYS